MLRKLKTFLSGKESSHERLKKAEVVPCHAGNEYEDISNQYVDLKEDKAYDSAQEDIYDNVSGSLKALVPLLDSRGNPDGREPDKAPTDTAAALSTFKAPVETGGNENDKEILDDILKELNSTCAELDVQIHAAEKQDSEKRGSPTLSIDEPISEELTELDKRKAVIEQTVEPTKPSVTQSCPDLSSIKLRQKKVTFSDTVERFVERPFSYISNDKSAAMAPPMDIDRGEEFISVDAPPKIVFPPPKPPRLKQNVEPKERSCVFAAIGSPLRMSKSEIVPIKLHHSNGIHSTKDHVDNVISKSQPKDDKEEKEETTKEKPVRELKPSIKIKSLKRTRTAFIVVALMCIGLTYSLPGLMLHALTYHIGGSYEEVSRSYSTNAVGLLLGIILSRVAHTVGQGSHDLSIILALLLTAGCTASVAWCSVWWHLMLALFGQGIGQGITLNGSLIQLRTLWGEWKWTTVINGVFCLMALCSAIMCQVVRLFLMESSHFISLHSLLQRIGLGGDQTPGLNFSDNVTKATDIMGDIGINYDPQLLPGVTIVFIVIALLCLVSCLLFMGPAMYTCTQKTRQRKVDKCNRQIIKAQMKENIKVVSNGVVNSKSCLKSPPDSILIGDSKCPNGEPQGDNSDATKSKDDEESLLCPGPCALEDQLAKLSFLAEEQVKRGVSVKKVTIREPPEPERFLQIPFSFDTSILLFLYVFFSFSLAMELSNGQFFYVYAAKCNLHIDLLNGSVLMTVFWSTVFISRVGTMILSKFLTPNAIMISCLTTSLICPIILLTYGESYLSLFWIFSVLYGLSLGPILPGGLTWANIFLAETTKALTIALCFGTLGAAIISWLAGFLLDFIGYQSLMYLNIASAALAILLYTPVMVILSRKSWIRLKPHPVPEPKTVKVSYV